jgi:hypothetical protein
MTGMIRKATLFAALGLVVASSAMAGIPSPANSTIPAFVDLVACDGIGALPPAARYKATITVRDLGNFALENVAVSIRFCSDVRIYATIPGGAVTDVVGGHLYTCTALTNASGQVTVLVSGAGLNATGASVGADGSVCATWYANDVAIGASSVATYDEDGGLSVAQQGIATSDLVRWAQDMLANPAIYKPRSDFDHSAALATGDLVFWAQYMLANPPFNASCGPLH